MVRRSSSATLIGASAILMWALLAVLGAATRALPPFQLTAMALAIGGAIGVGWALAQGRLAMLVPPREALLLGIAGLFGYHALYFVAIRLAPTAQANLVNYLWPLLIVMFSALLPGERIRAHHVVGALLGFAGTALLVSGGDEAPLEPRALGGYAAALGCAVTWAGYSVLSRRLGEVPTETVATSCLAAAGLSLACHLGFETTVWPDGGREWLGLLAIGVLPLGLAFYVWDHGVKRGDIALLGAASYATPLLSTLGLVLGGYAEATPVLGLAALAVTAGALVAAKDRLLRGTGVGKRAAVRERRAQVPRS